MAKIDTSSWKEFVIGDLFEKLDTKFIGKGKKKDAVRKEPDEEFCIPLTYAKRYNNGIMYWGRKGDFMTYRDVLSVIYNGAISAGRVYAQHEETGVLAESYMIRIKGAAISFYAYLFLQRIMEKCIYSRYSYSNLAIWTSVQNDVILLPVTEAGNPDWDYMARYMQEIIRESETCLENLRLADTSQNPIDTSAWKEFLIEDLFEKLDLKIKKEDFNKSRDVSEERDEEFSLPLVNAKHGNNGIMYFGRDCDFESAEMTIGIVQNGAIATGDVYAHPEKTGVLWDAYLVKPKENIQSKFVLMYLATVMEKSIKDKFSYDNKCVWDKAKQLTISLPADPTGAPDWAYMERYMSAMLQESESRLQNLC